MKISIVTPTLNIMRTLDEYMNAILAQDYPHEDIEIVIADGGSTDGSLEKLKEYNEKGDINITVVHNELRTAEAGKAVGVRKAEGEIVCLLDSDNIIPDSSWMTQMMKPFKEKDIVASEPLYFIARKGDGIINRYTAMLGMGDPLCLFMGNYDRYSGISGTWTKVKHDEEDRGDYLAVRFDKMIPTIGANGFCMRRKELIENFEGDYLFDIDVLWELFQKDSTLKVAKVKNGIIHLFCKDTKMFIKKQNRRVKDFLYFSDSKGRKYPWSSLGKGKIVLFILNTVTIIPLFIETLIGYFRTKKDFPAWCYHFVACWVTLWEYGWGVIFGLFKKEQADRDGWKQ